MASETVLVIEDDRDIRELLQCALEEEGYQVLLAPNGRDGLKLLKQVRPGVILLDLMMPVMTGWQVLDVIANNPDLSGDSGRRGIGPPSY